MYCTKQFASEQFADELFQGELFAKGLCGLLLFMAHGRTHRFMNRNCGFCLKERCENVMEDCKRVGFEVRRLDHMMRNYLEAGVKREGLDELTLMNGWFIRYLYEKQGEDVFQKDLEKQFCIARSTVTNTIQLMEERGLIQREFVKSDARLKKVTLTQKGIESHEKVEEIILRMNQQMVGGISDEELQTFLAVAERIRKNIEKDK